MFLLNIENITHGIFFFWSETRFQRQSHVSLSACTQGHSQFLPLTTRVRGGTSEDDDDRLPLGPAKSKSSAMRAHYSTSTELVRISFLSPSRHLTAVEEFVCRTVPTCNILGSLCRWSGQSAAAWQTQTPVLRQLTGAMAMWSMPAMAGSAKPFAVHCLCLSWV